MTARNFKTPLPVITRTNRQKKKCTSPEQNSQQLDLIDIHRALRTKTVEYILPGPTAIKEIS